MTNLMLPVAPKDVGRLSDVLISALASIGVKSDNRLKLPKVRHSVIVLVDGLGLENLKQSPAYARFLNGNLSQGIRCEFPSTTATSITGFATATRSGSHGMIGYSAYDRSKKSGVNLLTGWENAKSAAEYKIIQSLSESSPINAIGPKVYADSGFTELTMKSANYVSAETISDRFSILETLLAGSNSTLNYLYVPELDQLAHRFGVESTQWLNALEELDMVINRFVAKIRPEVGLIVTADHGVIDVSVTDHVYLDEFGWYTEFVAHTAGDPRCNFVYLSEGTELQEFLTKASEAFGNEAYVCTSEDLVEKGWMVSFTTDSAKLLPDAYLVWKGAVVGYDRRTSKPQHLKMIGQHGGISDAEMRVPLIRLGSY